VNHRLERCYARLLRLYPAAYRRERGAEMLGTLLDAADAGRDHPPRREVAALVVGALRARLGTAAAFSTGHGYPATLRMAALALVCHAVASAASHAGPVVFRELLIDRQLMFVWDIGYPLAFLTGIGALLLLARGSYRLGAGLVAVTFGLQQWAQGLQNLRFHPAYPDFWQLPLALALMLPLVWRRPAVPNQSWRWLFGIPIALVVLPTQFNEILPVQPFALWAVGIVALLLSMVDPRVGIAVAALLLAPILSLLGFYYLPGEVSDPFVAMTLLTYSTLAVPLIVVGAALIRRMRL
jgi:hypothetical protein